MAFFSSSRTMEPSISALFVGPTEAGKSHLMFQFQGPLLVISGEGRLYEFARRFDFEYQEVGSAAEALAIVDQVLNTPEMLAHFKTIAFDGFSRFWHEALEDVTEEEWEKNAMNAAKKLKGPFRDLMNRIFALRQKGLNVVMTAQSKTDWDTDQAAGEMKKKDGLGVKGDMDNQIHYAFSLIGYLNKKEGVRTLHVMKSSFEEYHVGEALENFDYNTHIGPLLDPATARINRKGAKTAPAPKAAPAPQVTATEVPAVEISTATVEEVPAVTAEVAPAATTDVEAKVAEARREIGTLLDELRPTLGEDIIARATAVRDGEGDNAAVKKALTYLRGEKKKATATAV